MTDPRWKIDDTTHPGRVFCEHLCYPRLSGELLPAKQVSAKMDRLPAPGNRWLTNLRWLEPDAEQGVVYEDRDMYDSLAAALEAYEAAKGQRPAATPKSVNELLTRIVTNHKP